MTPRTRLLLLDHVTSPTALVFPIERLVAELAARGVDALVDGAHALGMVPLDLDAPRRRVLHGERAQVALRAEGRRVPPCQARPPEGLPPVSISHGYAGGDARFRDEFDWTGTIDPTAALCIPD